MKKSIKQCLAGILSVLMIVSLIPLTSYAATTETVSINKSGTYTLFNSGNTGSATQYSGSQGVDNNPAGNTLTNNNYDIYGQMPSGGALTLRVGCSFTVLSEITEQVRFTIYAYDVDEEDGEVDTVYLVDETTGTRKSIGKLKGMDDQWNTTVLSGISNTLFTVGHTYHLENTISNSSSTSYVWLVYIRSVSMDVVCGEVAEMEITDHSFTASINSAGTVSTSLYLKTNKSTAYNLEYTAVNNGNQRGSLLDKSINATSSGTTARNSFSLLSGSDKGTYTVTVILKNPSNNNVVATYSATAGYSYSAVSYDPNGGSNNLPEDTMPYSSGNTVNVLFDNVPSKNGYTFIGWSTDKNATTPEFTATGAKTFTIGSSDVTLYAIYSENTVPVTPDPDDVDVWDGSVASGFESGTGTEEDPYIIKTAAQLAYLAQTTNAGNSYEGKFFKLANDIMLNTADMFARDADGNITGAAEGKTPYQWMPIGTHISSSDIKPFSGTFNGNGYEIIGIYINSGNDYQGLFGYCANATVKILGVVDGYVKGNYYVGGVVGRNSANSGTAMVENCYNTGTVSGSGCVGGVVGSNYAIIGTVTVANCYNTGTVSGSGDVGGVVGVNYGIATVTNCYNTGAVSGNDFVGGVVGENYTSYGIATVENCYYLTGTAVVGFMNNTYGNGTITIDNVAALTDTQMRMKSSFVGFDFDAVWTMDGDPDYPYPELRAFAADSDEPGDIDVWDGSVASGFESGTGTEDDPYIIKTAAQLAYLSETTNPNNKNGYFYTYTGIFFKLENDIVLNSTDLFDRTTDGSVIGVSAGKTPNEWLPIGLSTYGFSGSFDGNGHKISGVYIDSENNYQGLFSYCTNATVKNLGVTDSYVKGEKYVGCVIGFNSADSDIATVTVENCYSNGTVSGNLYVGGVVGYNDAGSNASTVTVVNCFNTGSISSENGYAGGVVGVNCANSSTATAIIANCYNTGAVTCSGSNPVGGVVGSNAANAGTLLLENCYNTGAVSGNYQVGGIAGRNASTATIINCYNTNTVSGNDEVGGIAGRNGGIATIIDCYNINSVNGNNYVGGVVGYNSAFATATVENCYNTGSVTGKSNVGGVVGYNVAASGSATAIIVNCYNIGGVFGSGSVGGVTGNNTTYYEAATASVTKCYNMGVVCGTGEYVGGVVGYNAAFNGGTMQGIRTVTVTDCYNNNSINGSNYVGGVVGYNYAYSNYKTMILNVSVTNCYNTGSINCSGEYVGGVVGYNYASYDVATVSVETCYYLVGTATFGYNNSTSGKGTITIDNVTALSDTQMRTQTNFIGFDFDNIWTMDGNPDYPYPELIGMEHVDAAVPLPHTHGYDEATRTEATCVKNGEIVYTCSCGDSYTEVIPALGHTESDWIIDTPATCTENGTKHKECSVCRTIFAVENIPALGHDFVDGECTRCHIHQYTITVNYVYADGTTVQPSVVKTLLEGEKYSITSPVISNYTADKAVVSGTAIQSLNITVTYREIEAQVIASIRRISLGNIDYNTPYSSLSLPETVLATTASGKTVSLKVFWNSTDYSPTTFGEQTINGTVIAAYGYKFGCEAKTTVTLTVTKNTIIRIPAMNLGRLPIGTTFDGLGVPSTAAVVTNSGSTHYLPVVWNIYSYDSSISGKHTIHGTLTLESGYALADGVANDVEISFELSETMYGTADIVFLIDTTGSMYDEIQNVKNNIKSFADMLEREGVSVRWALIEYRDITCDGVKSTKIIYSGSSEWYIDVNAYKDAISRLTVNGGGDREETVIDALKTATFLENRADAHSFYIVVTDADYKVNNQYGVTNMSEMISELKTNETITSVVTKTTYYKDYRSLTDGTGGILANIDGNFANELWKLSDLIVEDVVFGAVESIEIATAPNKTAYVSGDYFDGTGMTVKAIYTSGAEKIVTGYSVNPTRALSVSDTSIEINYRGKTATQTITVAVTEYPVTGVRVSPASLEMKPGEKKSVAATISPSSATNKNVYWVTDNPNVATVKDGVVEAYEPGTANITVYTADGGYSAVVTVCVSAKEVVVKGIYLDTGSIDIFVGESKKVSATVYPADATDKTIIWTSENETIATVDADGNITAVSKGTTTITATASGYTAKVLVTVSKHDAATPQYSIEDVKGYVSKNVDIYIAIENNPGIISLRNYISYDTDVLELIKIEDIGLLNGYTEPAENISSPYILRWADALATQNNMKNGNIVKLTFKIKEETHEGKYEVSVAPIESRNFIGQKIVFSPATAFVEVLPPVCIGDLDGDGEISDWDSIIFNRYLAGWDVEIINDAADIDGDGEVSDWDAILLDRYLAGWDVTIG